MKQFIISVYALPLKVFITVSALLFAAWCCGYAAVTRREKHRKLWKLVNALILTFTLFTILYLTVLRREPGNLRRVIWDAFYSFEEAKHYPEYYRLILLNTLAFLPVGLTLPALLPGRWPRLCRLLLAAFAAFLLSVTVETLQYLLALGNTELDDVIYNSFGGLVGSLAVLAEKRTRPAIPEKTKKSK